MFNPSSIWLVCIGESAQNSHLLNRVARVSLGSVFDKSSKLIMYNEMSSISERIGAMTSEHKNFVPAFEGEEKDRAIGQLGSQDIEYIL